jgi:2-polyprenyl-6-methoxyphenol hydroxylase-like FAD-dependent oxidoreductase
MDERAVQKIVIVGGGTAGWMAAAALSRALGPLSARPREITLVESPDIGTIGVGEATLPPIRAFNQMLGIEEAEFLRQTRATFKLGIAFQDWGHLGNRFFHGFGDFGPPLNNVAAIHYWLRLLHAGDIASHEQWSMATEMARGNRFARPVGDRASASNAYGYAYHFDASLFAATLRSYATDRGTRRIEGTIVDVSTRAGDGFVSALVLNDGRRVEGDLFIDCSGLRALLIEGVMRAGFDDWSHWLPVDRALAVPSEAHPVLTPYTVSTAKPAGWTWRIPLQHRIGNGHVYCSGFMADQQAEELLLQGLDTAALASPRLIRFRTGKRKRMWVKNVVALGLASGFLEPLESTSIQLIMDGIGRLIELFPDRACSEHLAAEFDRRMGRQYESIRDFIILHYKLNRRDDAEFWRHCRDMQVPDTVRHQIDLFKSSGLVAIADRDGFAEPSFVSILLGLGATPERHDPLVDMVDEARLRGHFGRLRETIERTVAAMPDHAVYIQRVLARPAH